MKHCKEMISNKKIILFIAGLLLLPFWSFNQQVDNSKKVRVVVTDNWKTKAFVVSDNFWDNKKEAIESQLGPGSLETIKKHFFWKNIPRQMSIWDGSKKKKLADLNKQLDRLKVYKIANFRHFAGGVDWGEYVILEVPYEENKDWDTTAKWDVVYFVMKAESIKEVQ